MKMKLRNIHRTSAVYLFAFAFVLGTTGFADLSTLTREERLEAAKMRLRVFPAGKLMDKDVWSALTQRDQALLLTYLRENVEKAKGMGYNDLDVRHISDVSDLAVLGDDSARKMVVENYVLNPNFESERISRLNDPAVIGMIGEQLFKEEPLTSRAGDVVLVAAQEVARNDILRLLVTTGAFAPEVAGWAKRMQMAIADPSGIEVMRRWFRANETVLKAGNFKMVQPGADPTPPTANAPGVVERSTASRSSNSIEPANDSVTFVSHAAKHHVVALACAAILIAAIFAFLIFLRRRD